MIFDKLWLTIYHTFWRNIFTNNFHSIFCLTLAGTKRKDGAKKRKLGRNPRVPFSPTQVATLEQKFRCTHYLSSIDVAELSAALNLSENRVSPLDLHFLFHFLNVIFIIIIEMNEI